jgi:hypothetical protein
LFIGENLPSSLDELVHDLKSDILCLSVSGTLENLGYSLPSVGVILELSENGLSLLLLLSGSSAITICESSIDWRGENGKVSVPALLSRSRKLERLDREA